MGSCVVAFCFLGGVLRLWQDQVIHLTSCISHTWSGLFQRVGQPPVTFDLWSFSQNPPAAERGPAAPPLSLQPQDGGHGGGVWRQPSLHGSGAEPDQRWPGQDEGQVPQVKTRDALCCNKASIDKHEVVAVAVTLPVSLLKTDRNKRLPDAIKWKTYVQTERLTLTWQPLQWNLLHFCFLSVDFRTATQLLSEPIRTWRRSFTLW